MKNFFKITRLTFAIFRAACFIILLMGVSLQFPSIQALCLNIFILQKHQTIKIEGFSGLFPFYFSFQKIKLYDHDQPRLTVKNIDIDWSAWNFVKQKIIAIHKLKIDRIEYHERFPTSTDREKKITLPKIPLGYIANLEITEAVYKTSKRRFKYTVTGNTRYESNGFEFNFLLKNLKEKSDYLTALIKYAKGPVGGEDTIDLALTAKEQQGLLHYLIPTLKGKLNLSLQGSGAFNNFHGKMSAVVGDINISSKLYTQQDQDEKNINIFSNHQYRTNKETYNLSGCIKTNSALTQFTLRNCALTHGNKPYIKIVGDIQRRGDFFESNNLNITIFISSKYTAVTAAQFNYNPYRFMVESNLKSDVLLKDQKVASFDIPVSAAGTLESLKIFLKGTGTIPDLPPTYKKYSQFNITAELDSKSMLHIPKIKLELSSRSGKINGDFLIGGQFNFNLHGNLLSNFFRFAAYCKGNKWFLAGENKTPDGQSLAISADATLKTGKDLALEGRARLKINDKDVDAEFSGRLDQAFHTLNIASLRIHHQESFFESKGTIDLSKEEGILTWHLYTFNLKDFFSKSTPASGTASLLGQLSINPQDWVLSFSGDFHKIFFNNIMVNSGMITGSMPLSNKNNLQFYINAKKSSAYDTIIDDFELNTSGTLDQFSTTIAMNGFTDQALKGNLAFSISDLSAINIEASSIQLGQHKILLSHPTRVLYKDNKLIIDPIEIDIDKGKLKLTGEITSESLSLKASLNDIPSQLPYSLTHGKFFLKGLINGKVHAYGHMRDPSLKLDIKTSDPLYASSLSGVYRDGSLKTAINLQSPQLALRLEGRYPLNLSFAPIQFDLDHSRTFHTNLIARGALDSIQQIFDLNYDKLSGNIDANISLYGTIDSPASKGYINVTQGTYERQNIGLKLHDLNLGFTARNGHFVLNEPVTFQDHQNKNGNILFAKLGIGKFLVPYLKTEIMFNKIHFIDLPSTRRGGMSAFCSGTLKAEGSVNALAIYIRGEISSLEKYIGETEETPIYKANIIHHHLPATLSQTANEQSTSKTTYDIDLALERKFHIFGQGLDSTWKGRLIIQGTATAPLYKGQFVLQEGQLRILDRFFDIQRGEIFFNGDLSPKLYIESELKLQDMRVKIILEGDSANLQKRFVSDKNLSEPEILQKLFFNRTSTVSQSFQALNYLAASSFISSFINIGFYQQEDPLRHTQKEFISIRQKFSKRIYGKVDFGINSDSETDRVSLAAGFQPTPQTNTEITFSPNRNRLGIGVEWSKDF